MNVRIKVIRASLPHGAAFYIREQASLVTMYADSSLTAEELAECLELATNRYARCWRRVNYRPPAPIGLAG